MLYDLEERTAKFGETIIRFCRESRPDNISSPIINQLIRSATSVGANYMEANHASSKKDFKNKIQISLKECNETKHWIRMLAEALPERKEAFRELWQEAQELTLIFATIAKNCNLLKN